MANKRTFGQRIFGLLGGNSQENQKQAPKPEAKAIDDRPNVAALPGGRSSTPTIGHPSDIVSGASFKTVQPSFLKEIIPIIRALSVYNGDVSQAVHNVVSLANTGHKIFFDRNVKPEMVDKMRNHLINKRKTWASGQAGMDGIVNRMIAQLLIGGAISNEWVPNNELTGIESVILVNPEEIEFELDERRTKYIAYQRPGLTGSLIVKPTAPDGLRKLNPNTYRYFAIGGDSEIPYGIPPYIPVLKRVGTQKNMDTNIDFVIDQMGLIGFLEVLMDKPQEGTGENNTTYESRLDTLLTQAKQRVIAGLKDGVVAGFKEDHEFNFNSFSKSYDHALSLYDNNELQVATALKQDASLWGRSYATSETQITVVFMKMLSEFRNLHNILKENLEFGYALELRLAGFQFDYLTVKFNRSTIQDDLKFQQAEEIKVRNVKDKLILGLINQDQAADELGYEVPAYPEPRITFQELAGKSAPGLATDGEKKSQDRKAGKNKSRSEGTKKSKPVNKD